ncbi:MAG TPA: SRPBCC family protein [Geobacterales bacterium]|nr:SRPBCC family protein [Geobacterales bacterium]
MIKSAFLIATASFCFAGSAFALDVKKMVDVPAAPEAVWKTIGDYCGIANWHPAIEKCEISKKDGATFRTLSLKGGGTILEKQTAWDDKSRTYSYTIEESPLPVANYKATISVAPKGSGSAIIWTSNFNAKGADDAKASSTIGGIFDAGLASIAAKAK